ASAEVAGVAEGLVGRASRDVDDDRRHATLDRFGVSYWNFLWLHSPVSAEDVAVDRCGVALSLQQDRCPHCGNAARRLDLGDAGVICCRIPVGVLDIESASSPAGTLSPLSTARLRALACFFTGRLANLLAGTCRFALYRRSFGDICLL